MKDQDSNHTSDFDDLSINTSQETESEKEETAILITPQASVSQKESSSQFNRCCILGVASSIATNIATLSLAYTTTNLSTGGYVALGLICVTAGITSYALLYTQRQRSSQVI